MEYQWHMMIIKFLKTNVHIYGKLHTCVISMTDDNKVLAGNKSKYEIFNAKKN